MKAISRLRHKSKKLTMGVRHDRGFTLIELLFIVAIVSVLAMLVLSIYRGYKGEVIVLAGLIVAAPAKASVTETYLTNGSWPTSNGDAGLEDPEGYRTKYIDELIIGEGGQITLKYGYPGFGTKNTLLLTPEFIDNKVIWDCSKGSIDSRYRPEDCE
jgi:type IV pilus assembly protein PilA